MWRCGCWVLRPRLPSQVWLQLAGELGAAPDQLAQVRHAVMEAQGQPLPPPLPQRGVVAYVSSAAAAAAAAPSSSSAAAAEEEQQQGGPSQAPAQPQHLAANGAGGAAHEGGDGGVAVHDLSAAAVGLGLQYAGPSGVSFGGAGGSSGGGGLASGPGPGVGEGDRGGGGGPWGDA